MNLPNALTIFRLLVAPAVAALLVADPGGSLPAAGLFLLASATDFLDGHLARSRGSVTRFGTLADPLADKLLIVLSLFALVSLDRLAAWVAAVILVRELAVSVLRQLAAREGTIIAASQFGKAKMGAQVATVAVLIAVPEPHAAWVLTLVYATVAVTVASGIDYFLGFRRTAPPAPAPPQVRIEPQRELH